MRRPTGRDRATEARLRWAIRRVLEERFGVALRAHDRCRPPDADRARFRAWVAEGLRLHADLQELVGRVHHEVDRMRAAGPVTVDALELLLEAARHWPVNGAAS